MIKYNISIYGLILLVNFLTSCSGGSESVTPFGFEQPSHFPEATYTFDNNEITEEGFELGKTLFFDPILSRDSTVSCGSCHDQSIAFADPQHRLSIGIDSQVGTRNAPAIFNLAFVNEFFWDGGVVHIDFIPINPIENEIEMDNDINTILETLQSDDTYVAKFKDAFGEDSEINSARFLHAMSQFMVMLVSANSTYDQYLTDGAVLSDSELKGLALFETHCESCHSGVLFTDRSFRNNGLDGEITDIGRELITSEVSDRGLFKVPSLRNVGLTSPYMHDGRFETLDEVLDHYSSDVQLSETLDPLLNVDGVLGIILTEDEKGDIIDFLHTLTDDEFTSNPLFFVP